MERIIAAAPLEVPEAWSAARAAVAQSVAASQHEPMPTLQLVADQLGHLIGDRCWLHLVSADGQWLELRAATERTTPDQPATRLAAPNQPLPVDAGVNGLAMRTGQSVQWPGPGLTSTLEEATTSWWSPPGLPIHSLLVVPLIVQGYPAGTLSLTRQLTAQPYTPADRQQASELAAQAALTIEKARLYAALRTHEEEGLKFVSRIAHELRTPLTGINGMAQLLQRRCEYSEPGLAVIVERTQHLEGLISTLLDAARLADGRLALHRERCELLAIIRSLLAASHRAAPERSIRLVTSETAVSGWWDAVRVGQLVQHLLSNALAYSPVEREVVVEVTQASHQATVSVIDQGIGLTPAEQQCLFQRFFRGEPARRQRANGLGLGLTISKGLVEAHGGTITVTSTPGVGSCFRLTLPQTSPPGTG